MPSSAPAPSSDVSHSRRSLVRRRTMRGGLGRTLLTAFLLLAIGPLSLISIFAISRTRQQHQQQQAQQLALLAESYRSQLDSAVRGARTLTGNEALQPPDWVEQENITRWQVGGQPLQLWAGSDEGALLLPLASILEQIRLPEGLQGANLYLETGGSFFAVEPGSPRLPATLARDLGTARMWEQPTFVSGPEGKATLVGYAPLSSGVTVLVTRSLEAEQSVADTLAAALVAAALVASLLTTVGAAIVTRSITQPLYELTRTAVQIARGDLRKRADLQQENELGILALAFNTMTDRLNETLATLEERVEERTVALQLANDKIESRARQLELIAELGTVLSAIHDLQALLEQAARLAAGAFGYADVAIWLLGRRADRDPGLALRACLRPELAEGTVHEGAPPDHIAHRTLATLQVQWSDDRRSLALPLRMVDNVVGVIVLNQRDPFEAEDQPSLQILADTLTVAIENARATEMERSAVAKLRRLEQSRQLFLGEMSHELSTSLNSIIGFSGLLLKEVQGPLNTMQRDDLTFINRNGKHLLEQLNGLLELLEAEQVPDEWERAEPAKPAATPRPE